MSFFIAKLSPSDFVPIFFDEDGNEYQGPTFSTEEEATDYALAH